MREIQILRPVTAQANLSRRVAMPMSPRLLLTTIDSMRLRGRGEFETTSEWATRYPANWPALQLHVLWLPFLQSAYDVDRETFTVQVETRTLPGGGPAFVFEHVRKAFGPHVRSDYSVLAASHTPVAGMTLGDGSATFSFHLPRYEAMQHRASAKIAIACRVPSPLVHVYREHTDCCVRALPCELSAALLMDYRKNIVIADLPALQQQQLAPVEVIEKASAGSRTQRAAGRGGRRR